MRPRVALAFAALSACSGSSSTPCGAMQALESSAMTNGGPCANDAGVILAGAYTLSIASSAFDVSGCAAVFNSSACSAADQSAENADIALQQACYTNAGTCSPADAGAWAMAVTNCLNTSRGSDQSLSQSCTTALLDAGL